MIAGAQGRLEYCCSSMTAGAQAQRFARANTGRNRGAQGRRLGDYKGNALAVKEGAGSTIYKSKPPAMTDAPGRRFRELQEQDAGHGRSTSVVAQLKD